MGNALDTCCLPQNVRVVTPEGTVVGYSGEVVTVRDVLQTYSHHYLTEAGQETTMLEHDEVLKPGNTYMLQPLPRLFNVVHCQGHDETKQPCASYSCCVYIATGGLNTFELSDDDPAVGEEGRVFGRSSPTSKTCVNKTAKTIARLPSALPAGLEEILKSAEIEWKEIADSNKPWVPDLESIREEPMKSPVIAPMMSPMMSPMLRSPLRTESGRRPSLATLMKEEAARDAEANRG